MHSERADIFWIFNLQKLKNELRADSCCKNIDVSFPYEKLAFKLDVHTMILNKSLNGTEPLATCFALSEMKESLDVVS